MGKGKTRLGVELCKGKLLQKALGHAVNFVRVTDSEGFRPVVDLRESVEVRFAKALLQFHGIDVSDLQHVASLADMDYLLREKLMAVGVMRPYKSGTKQVLVVCVDELLHLLEGGDASYLVHGAMKYQESTEKGEKPTIFVFTTLTDKQGLDLTLRSGREPCYYDVPTVPEGKLRAVAEDLVPNFNTLYKESAAFRQLFHIGVHNARYIIDGFCSLDFTTYQQVDKTNWQFQLMFEKAMDRSGLSVAVFDKTIVEKWIFCAELSESDDKKEALRERNLMYEDADSQWRLSPILLRRWALKNPQDELGAALNHMYLADTAVEFRDGAPMESVIMNLEVATRLAWNAYKYNYPPDYRPTRPLCDWFPGGMIKQDYVTKNAAAEWRFPVKQIKANTFMTKAFAEVETALLQGQYVNPGHDSGQGIDYLAPLWIGDSSRPTILAYQHKNRKSLKKGTEEKERDAYIRVVGGIWKAPIVDKLSQKGYNILPVLFTTTHADRTIRNKRTGKPAKKLAQQLDKLCPKGWVVFDLKGTEKFTHRLGSMRHVILKLDTNGNDMRKRDKRQGNKKSLAHTANGNDMGLPAGLLLASRPVWRATPSRVSHIRNHVWNTQPPAFGARMTGYVPLLRRLSKLI